MATGLETTDQAFYGAKAQLPANQTIRSKQTRSDDLVNMIDEGSRDTLG